MKNGVNKKYSLALLIAALLLTGCDSDEERAIDLVEKDIRSTLLDPDAGRFTNMRAIQLGENSYSYMVCGEVNGKNVLNAYTGATAFNAHIFDVRERNPIVFVAMDKSTNSYADIHLAPAGIWCRPRCRHPLPDPYLFPAR